MTPSEFIFRLVAAASLIGTAVAALAGIWLLIQTVRGRIASPWSARLLATGWGLTLGFVIVAADRWPTARVFAIAVLAVEFLALLWRNRRALAGLVLAAAALPWTLLWGAYVLEITLLDAFWDPYVVWTFFLVGAAVLAIGALLVLFGRGTHLEADRRAPADQPGSRRIGTVADALRGPKLFGLGPADLIVVSEMVGIGLVVAAVAANRPTAESVGLVVVGIGLAAAIGWILYPIAWPSRLRRANEAFLWMGEWERDRWFAMAGANAAFTPKDLVAWIDAHPETPGDRWLRYEILALADRLDDARAVALRLPLATPFEQVERAAALDLIDWMGGGEGDLPALRAAVESVEPADGDDRLRAEVVLAVAETKRRRAEGTADPLAPLVAMRDRLGPRADGLLARVVRRRASSLAMLRMSATLVLIMVVGDMVSRLII